MQYLENNASFVRLDLSQFTEFANKLFNSKWHSFVNNKCKLKGLRRRNKEQLKLNYTLVIFYCIPENLALSCSPSLKMTDQSLLSIAQALIKLDEFFHPPVLCYFSRYIIKAKKQSY